MVKENIVNVCILNFDFTQIPRKTMRFAKKHFEYFEHTYEQRHLYIHIEGRREIETERKL